MRDHLRSSKHKKTLEEAEELLVDWTNGRKRAATAETPIAIKSKRILLY